MIVLNASLRSGIHPLAPALVELIIKQVKQSMKHLQQLRLLISVSSLALAGVKAMKLPNYWICLETMCFPAHLLFMLESMLYLCRGSCPQELQKSFVCDE